MGPIWVTFTEGRPACAEIPKDVKDDGVVAFVEALPAAQGRKVLSWAVLPYPASPRLNETDWISETDGRNYGPCPSFCYRPGTCRGKTSCPSQPACSE